MAKPGALIVFGEVHGTNEAPAFVGDAACALAWKNRVHIGLEMPAEDAPLLAQFFSGTGDDALRASKFWSSSYQDGRASTAMLRLLGRVREYRRNGASLEVFFFDDPTRLTVQRRDEAMAENISKERHRAPEDIYLIEVGNYHARTTIGAPWDASKKWMAGFLAEREPHLVTLDMRALPGTTWVCIQSTPGDTQTCGEREVKGIPNTSADSAERSMKMEPLEGGAYAGMFSVGTITASPPAFARR